MSPVTKLIMTPPELIELILGLTGKDPVRIQEILTHGTFVSGQSRYRWSPLNTTEKELIDLLDRFPDIQPERPFEASLCYLVTFRGRRGNVHLPREVAEVRRWFKKISYWDALLEILENTEPRYQTYSYSKHSDVYSTDLSLEMSHALLSKSALLKYTSLVEQLHHTEPIAADAFVKR